MKHEIKDLLLMVLWSLGMCFNSNASYSLPLFIIFLELFTKIVIVLVADYC